MPDLPAPRQPAHTLLIRDADCVATFDAGQRELKRASVLVRGGLIEAVGQAAELPQEADEVIDGRGHAVLPGLVNSHHHMSQSLTRAVPGLQDAELFGWLRGHYPLWAGLTPEMVRVSTQVAMAELLLSGCTTSSDHLYLYPNGVRLDDSIEAAAAIGMRFVACRGSMSVGESQGGLPPDALVEGEAAILRDSERVIAAYHDASHGSMLNVALAPCSPFSVSPALMRESAALARAAGVRLHTHLAENDHDVAYGQARFGCTPAEYAEQTGWLGNDVWHAHCVKLDEAGIGLFAASRTGVAHCPCSNMRLASGIAPIRRMLDAGVAVGLGVDGSASNDGAQLARRSPAGLAAGPRRRVAGALRLRPCAGGDERARRASHGHPWRRRSAGPQPRHRLPGARLRGRSRAVRSRPRRARRRRGARRAGQPGAVRADIGCLDDRRTAASSCAKGRLATLELEPLVERHNMLARELVRGH